MTILKYTDVTICILNVLKILVTGLDKSVVKSKKLAGIQSIPFYAYHEQDKCDLRGAGLSCVPDVSSPPSPPPSPGFCHYGKLSSGLCSLLVCVAVCLWALCFPICEMKVILAQLLRCLMLCR